MTKSIARRHFEKTVAERSARAAASTEGEGAARRGGIAGPRTGGTRQMSGTSYDLMLAQLRANELALKDIKSIEKKIEAKREFLPTFTDYVEGVIAAGTGMQDDVVATVMVWLLDCGQYDDAMPVLEYVLNYQLALPERFARPAPDYVLETVADAVLSVCDAGGDPPEDLYQTLRNVIALTKDADIFDPVRAKAMKAMGLMLEWRSNQPDGEGAESLILAALDHYDAALRLNPKAGVKKRADALRKRLETPSTKPDGKAPPKEGGGAPS
jgi:hypothetical protein